MPSQVVHVVQKLNVTGALAHFATSEHTGLRGHHHVDRSLGDLAEQPGIIDEAGDVCGHKAVEHAARAYGFAGEDAGIDRRLGVVAHDRADELHAGGHAAPPNTPC